MTAGVPTLTGSLVLTDPQSIIAYTIRRYMRQPADTIPLLPDMIISLPWRVAKYGKEPDALCNNIQSDLQDCLNRIFAGERKINVTCNFTSDQTDTYNVTIAVMFSTLSGDLNQTGISITLKNGRLIIPEDNLNFTFLQGGG